MLKARKLSRREIKYLFIKVALLVNCGEGRCPLVIRHAQGANDSVVVQPEQLRIGKATASFFAVLFRHFCCVVFSSCFLFVG